MKKEISKSIEFYFSDEERKTIEKALKIFKILYDSIEEEKITSQYICEGYDILFEIFEELESTNYITIEG